MATIIRTDADLSIPDRRRPHGPLTLRRLRVMAVVLWTIWVIGLVPVIADWAPHWKAFGLGLLFPGGGFLYTSDIPFFILTLLAVPYIAIFQFQFRADTVSPVLLVLASAWGASLRAHTGPWDWAQWVVPAILPAVWIGVRVGRRRAFARARARGMRRNAYLRELRPSVPEASATGPEMTAEDLAVARWLLDRALQAKDRFDGFDWSREQFSMASIRYQLNWMQWALALLNYTRTPAFGGYLAAGQRNLIEKMTDRRAWEYWRLENTWGNLDPNPDPIRRDNIMYSGYLGLMLGMYAATTGDRSFDEPGSLSLRWNDRRSFVYDHPSVIDAVIRNYRSTPWGLFPCEPGLNFVGCNAIGLLGVMLWDQVTGSAHSPAISEPLRRSLEAEFTTADGDIITIISRRHGYSMRFARSAMAQAGQGLFNRPFAPDLADRAWAVLRREVIAIDGDGLLQPKPYGLTKGRLDRMDLGSKKPSPVGLIASLGALARELGDEETYRAAEAAADATLGPVDQGGTRSYTAASAYANAYLALARFGWKDAWFNLMTKGMPAGSRSGPRLAAAPYPEVLVARAVTDGTTLDAVLVPGAEGGRFPLGIERLTPGRRYRVSGAAERDVAARPDGTAAIHVDLSARTELRVTPVT
ncbi:MAG: hypothetical protein WEB06_07295 [Actinomycetota bacterium]